jgi:hypothetical protein
MPAKKTSAPKAFPATPIGLRVLLVALKRERVALGSDLAASRRFPKRLEKVSAEIEACDAMLAWVEERVEEEGGA